MINIGRQTDMNISKKVEKKWIQFCCNNIKTSYLKSIIDIPENVNDNEILRDIHLIICYDTNKINLEDNLVKQVFNVSNSTCFSLNVCYNEWVSIYGFSCEFTKSFRQFFVDIYNELYDILLRQLSADLIKIISFYCLLNYLFLDSIAPYIKFNNGYLK